MRVLCDACFNLGDELQRERRMRNILATTALTLSIGVAGSAMAQDAEAGKKVFKKCTACHKVGEKAKNATGPVLNNVIGRAAGSLEGYKFSKTLKAANEAGLIWNSDNIAEYITDPKEFMKAFLDDPKAKPKMTFKLKDEQQRADVIAYLAQFSDPVESMSDDKESSLKPTKVPAMAETDHMMSTEGKICVQNASAQPHFFAAEIKDGMRVTQVLAASETLCTTADAGANSGVVSVFENETHLEGCSRLVKAGMVEKMLKYAEFDRCAWSSNIPS